MQLPTSSFLFFSGHLAIQSAPNCVADVLAESLHYKQQIISQQRYDRSRKRKTKERSSCCVAWFGSSDANIMASSDPTKSSRLSHVMQRSTLFTPLNRNNSNLHQQQRHHNARTITHTAYSSQTAHSQITSHHYQHYKILQEATTQHIEHHPHFTIANNSHTIHTHTHKTTSHVAYNHKPPSTSQQQNIHEKHSTRKTTCYTQEYSNTSCGLVRYDEMDGGIEELE